MTVRSVNWLLIFLLNETGLSSCVVEWSAVWSATVGGWRPVFALCKLLAKGIYCHMWWGQVWPDGCFIHGGVVWNVLPTKCKTKRFPSPALSCLSSPVVRCSWDPSMSEDWATCWVLTVPAAARCPAPPWCLGTASMDGCSTQSTCWHIAGWRKLCCWKAMWVEADKQKGEFVCVCVCVCGKIFQERKKKRETRLFSVTTTVRVWFDPFYFLTTYKQHAFEICALDKNKNSVTFYVPMEGWIKLFSSTKPFGGLQHSTAEVDENFLTITRKI